jgi:hypothetical protein
MLQRSHLADADGKHNMRVEGKVSGARKFERDATGLSRGVSRYPLHAGFKITFGCHGLVPWRFTISATRRLQKSRLDATALCRGGSRYPLHAGFKNHAWMPRPCAVEVHVRSYVALNVKLHGSSPWHLVCGVLKLMLAASVKLHGASPWHLVFGG